MMMKISFLAEIS